MVIESTSAIKKVLRSMRFLNRRGTLHDFDATALIPLNMRIAWQRLYNRVHDTLSRVSHVSAKLLMVWTIVLAAVAGCVEEDTASGLSGASAPDLRPVVIAFLDSGINPYHEAFAATQVASTDLTSVTGALPITLSGSGDYEARLSADTPMWNSLETRQLIAFSGTRILAISFNDDEAPPILDPIGHGTATASVAALADPALIILSIQPNTLLCLPDKPCWIRESMPEAMRWAAEQPWIDIISVSLGNPGNKPTLDPIERNTIEWVEATRLAAANGKLVINSAGNEPTLTATDAFSGPPWIISVGGGRASDHGASLFSSKGADVIANYTQRAARYDDTTAFEDRIGTSFSGPAVAAVLSSAMRTIHEQPDGPELREATSAASLRTALNLTALRWAPTEWRPELRTDLPSAFLDAHAPILVGPAQRGWGHVDGSIVDELVAVARGAEPTSPPDALTLEAMARYQEARERYWS